jgi:cell division septation protein DedD
MQEEQKKYKISFEGKEPDIVSENTEKNQSGCTPTYCTICNKQIDKYGRRKEDFKKPGWVFCPKHGWIQEGTYVKEMDIEKPLRLSIEEVQDDHDKNKKPPKKVEYEILPEIETPNEFLIEKERQQEIEFPSKEQPQTVDLSTNVARNKLTLIGIIVSVIFFFVIVSFLIGYFVWEGTSREMIEIKSMQALAHNKKLKITQDQSKIPDLSQESASQKKSTVEVSDLSVSKQTRAKEEIIRKSPQVQKPFNATYSVQVGAFTNISNARSLENSLKKRGYHCFVSTSNSNGEAKFHKVLIGKFKNRKKAESFSNEITKAVNIQAFVAVWESNI